MSRTEALELVKKLEEFAKVLNDRNRSTVDNDKWRDYVSNHNSEDLGTFLKQLTNTNTIRAYAKGNEVTCRADKEGGALAFTCQEPDWYIVRPKVDWNLIGKKVVYRNPTDLQTHFVGTISAGDINRNGEVIYLLGAGNWYTIDEINTNFKFV